MNIVSVGHQEVIELARIVPAEIPILLQGGTGVGKTSICHEIAKAMGDLPVIVFTVSDRTETDLTGLPVQCEGTFGGMTTFLPPAEMIAALERPCVIFFDEINRGLAPVRNACQRALSERTFGCRPDGQPYRFHPETRMLAAINVGSSYTDTEALDAAMVRRFLTVNLVPRFSEWKAWAERNNFDPLLLEFLEKNPSKWNLSDDELDKRSEGTVFPTLAGWHNVSKILNQNQVTFIEYARQKKKVPQTFRIAISGIVGTDTQNALVTFVETYTINVSPLDVYRAGSTEKATELIASLNRVEAKSGLYQFCAELTSSLKGHIESGAVTPERFIERLPVILDNIPAEKRVNLINDVKGTLANMRMTCPALREIDFQRCISEPLRAMLMRHNHTFWPSVG